MKKIISISLILCLIMALSVSAFADSPSSQTMDVSYTVDANYVVTVPDGLTVDPDSGKGEMDIGVNEGSVIPGDKALQMSVNAGTHYDENSKSYCLLNGSGGQLLGYTLTYKGTAKNPGAADASVVLETVDAENANLGFEGKIGVTVGIAKAAGVYTDTLTFSFKIVEAAE